MNDEYLELLIEKRDNAKIDLVHCEIELTIPNNKTDEEIRNEINYTKGQIETYTDCIETYKSMEEKLYVLSILKNHFYLNIDDEINVALNDITEEEEKIIKEWLEND